MKVLIVEDEVHAQNELQRLLKKVDPNIQIIGVIPSIRESVKWLKANQEPDVIFMDIMLSDGESFEIFRQVEVHTPIIFTTAFNDHTLKAFRHNSVDYLLKPVDVKELKRAIEKYHGLVKKYGERTEINLNSKLQELLNQDRKEYKHRFVVRTGENIRYISIPDISWFYSSNEIVYMVTHDSKKFAVNYTLDELQEVLDPKEFFRITRKYITKIGAVSRVTKYFNSRLKIELNPPTNEEIIISRARVQSFLEWLEK